MVHGITDQHVKGKKLDEKIIEMMIHKADFLISHNAPFDRGFVSRLFKTCQKKLWLCSMRGINWRSKGYSSMALQNLLRDHQIKVAKAHRAQYDMKSAITLLSQQDNHGKTYLFELIEKL